VLLDGGGNDHYVGDRRAQGQAVVGCGILLDRGGDDDFRGALLAQGVGGPLGFGLLADLSGRDHYFAGGKYPGGYDDTPENMGAMIEDFLKNGFLNIVGGCCGTTPDHIAAIAKAVSPYPPRPIPAVEPRLRLSGLEAFVQA
jgi:hypothetical protein